MAERLRSVSGGEVGRGVALDRIGRSRITQGGTLAPLGATVAVAVLAGLLVAAVARVLSRPTTTSATRVSRLIITVSPGQELGYRETPLVATSPAGTHQRGCDLGV